MLIGMSRNNVKYDFKVRSEYLRFFGFFQCCELAKIALPNWPSKISNSCGSYIFCAKQLSLSVFLLLYLVKQSSNQKSYKKLGVEIMMKRLTLKTLCTRETKS